jgi:hypothetical protein
MYLVLGLRSLGFAPVFLRLPSPLYSGERGWG